MLLVTGEDREVLLWVSILVTVLRVDHASLGDVVDEDVVGKRRGLLSVPILVTHGFSRIMKLLRVGPGEVGLPASK